jgi:hypothetical protein
MLEMMFRFQHTFVDDGTRLWIDFGDTVVEPEMVTGSVNNVSQLSGRNAGAVVQAFDAAFTQEVNMVTLPEGPDAANGATIFPSIFCHLRIVNPFGFVTGGKDFGFRANTVGFGTFYHFANNYTLAAVSSVSHFSITRLHPVKLGKDWRINFKEQTAGTRVTPISGDGWVYGYYTQAVSENQEFDGVI